MRVLVINPNTSRKVSDQLIKVTRHLEDENLKIDVKNVEFGPDAIETEISEAISATAVLDKLDKEKENYDGAVIACFADPGLKAARELVDMPVVGIAEAAFLCATLLGTKFSIITTGGQEDISMSWEIVRKHYMDSRCASIKYLNSGVLGVSGDTLKMIEEKACEAILEDGANVILLGCAAMSGIEIDIAKEMNIPVMDGVTQGILLVQMMASKQWKSIIKFDKKNNYPISLWMKQ